ncbi:MAG: DNA-directed RNA polymerase subunit alpha [Spirochaetia bacterium]
MARRNLFKGMKRPKNIVFEPGEETANYGKFIAYPFERGYGYTIGNSLRRVLLSSIQGYAVVAVRIQSLDAQGVAHVVASEFEAIPHVKEDVPTIIQNLKMMHLALPEEVEEKTVLLECRGQKSITAGDFAMDGLEVMNPELPICSLMAEANLEIEIQVNFGRGYVPAEEHVERIDVVGTLPVDSLFSPVHRVQVHVEDCRIGQSADYDKLILEVWTNGIIRPSDAVAEAAKIAKEHFSIFINFDENTIIEQVEADAEELRLHTLLETSVEQLDLSVRSSNCLKNANIRTLKDLTRKTEEDLARTRNFGKKSLQEIKEKLKEWNLGLAMTDYGALKESFKQESNSKREE